MSLDTLDFRHQNFYSIKKETEFYESQIKTILENSDSIEEELEKEDSSRDYDDILNKLDDEINDLTSKIKQVRKEKQNHLKKLKSVSSPSPSTPSSTSFTSHINNLKQIKHQLLTQVNNQEVQLESLQEEKHSLEIEYQQNKEQLHHILQCNPLNDSFHIWFAGPFGTINNFRLGSLPAKPIDTQEINAALGQTALLVSVLAYAANFEFEKYVIHPLGSFSKITKKNHDLLSSSTTNVSSNINNSSLNNSSTINSNSSINTISHNNLILKNYSHPVYGYSSGLPLFLDNTSFSLFPKRNFNNALIGLFSCVQELGEYVREYDPTMAMPYKIFLDSNMIGSDLSSSLSSGNASSSGDLVSFLYGSNDEHWTRSLKFLLANIKWIVAWYTKHGKNIQRSY